MRTWIRLLVLSLLLALPAGAADRVRYVDTGAAAAGNGTTSALSGANCAYDDLAECLTDELAADSDITNEGNLVIHCNRTGGGGVDTSSVSVSASWVTDATHYIYIVADDFPATGTFNSSKYYLHNNDGDVQALELRENYVRVENFQVYVTGTGANQRNGIHVTGIAAGGSDIRITNCIVTGAISSSATCTALTVNDADATVTVCNTISYNFVNGADSDMKNIQLSAGTAYFYNCTSFGGYYGIRNTSGTGTATNCIIGNNTDDISGTWTLDYITLDDADVITNHFHPAGGDWSTEFVNIGAGTEDFDLLVGAVSVNAGTSDPGGANQPDTDIIGTARSTWDIGAFEYLAPAAGGGQAIFIVED